MADYCAGKSCYCSAGTRKSTSTYSVDAGSVGPPDEAKKKKESTVRVNLIGDYGVVESEERLSAKWVVRRNGIAYRVLEDKCMKDGTFVTVVKGEVDKVEDGIELID